MKKKFCQTVLFSALLFAPLLAKPQLVKEEFTISSFNEQFDEDKGTWRNMSTSDNLFLIQEGEYLLRRKNPASGYSIFSTWKNMLPAFSLMASVKLEDSKNEEASVGLIFMAQADGSGAFVFEFNPKGQYRLKQLVGLNFKLLTGDAKTNGWVNSDALNPLGQYNLVEVRTAKRNYDIYVNQKYLLSFTEIAYKTGDIGIAIGAATKARLDFIMVNEPKSDASKISPPTTPPSSDFPTHSSVKSKESNTSKNSEENTSSPCDVVLKLVDQITNLKIESQVLRDSLSSIRKQLKAARSATQDPK